jgi:prevent-host-death family protein
MILLNAHSAHGALAKRTGLRTLIPMAHVSATKARAQLYRLIDAAAHEPVHIIGKRGNAVLISESDWHSLQETLHLSSIPGMKASLKKGRAESVAKCKRKLPW